MPNVKVNEECIVWTSPVSNTVYAPADCVLAPDAHIEEIVRQGKGERLTERGDRFNSDTPNAGPDGA